MRTGSRVTSVDLALPYDLETVNAVRPLGRDGVLLRAERSRTWLDHGYCDWALQLAEFANSVRRLRVLLYGRMSLIVFRPARRGASLQR
ncbi:hypothetical protein [Nonomuraea sp. SYSU D8015]|uniref:hypothetical protein n=1 Tax=Nonomuraea sp. SYSU D8015 TaxID=2593644 RepID=UPI0016608A8C|nr:hypothetical protein [Nonomuraea sp. SYSU D8015]